MMDNGTDAGSLLTYRIFEVPYVVAHAGVEVYRTSDRRFDLPIMSMKLGAVSKDLCVLLRGKTLLK